MCVCAVGTGSVVRCVSRLYLNGCCVCQNRGNSSDTAGVLTSWSRLQENVKMHFLGSAVCLLGSKKKTPLDRVKALLHVFCPCCVHAIFASRRGGGKGQSSRSPYKSQLLTTFPPRLRTQFYRNSTKVLQRWEEVSCFIELDELRIHI